MTEKRKRNIVIGALCGVLLLMVVGYAAFSSILNIKGTTNISSNWDIRITNVESKNVVGSASNAEDPEWDNLTATFKTNLEVPGDSIEYDVTVENKGTLNAKLDKINMTASNNPAIKFTATGLKEGDKLNAGSSAVLTVKVEYDKDVTSQPTNTIASLQVTLDYVQDDGAGEVVTPPTTDSVLYRFGMDTVNIGDSVDTLNGTTEDYNTLGHNVFMKHTLNDGKVASTEVCFISGGLHCLKQESYEANKATLVGIYGEDKCEIDDTKTLCKDSVNVLATSGGDLIVYTDTEDCDLNSDGSSECFE